MVNIDGLTTETVNEATKHIDEMDALGIVTLINQEDKKVAEAIEKELPNVAKAVDAVAERFKKGGRIIYCGAGTSGRMGTLDAVELTPTYSVSPDRAFGLLAGGEKAMYLANWYLPDYFSENRVLVPSMIFAAGALIILLILTIGGAVV